MAEKTVTFDSKQQRPTLSRGLVVQHLTAAFGSDQVLTDIHIVFPPRQVTAIIGPSGAGKSTLLRCLNRLNEGHSAFHWTGDIRLDGKNIMNEDQPIHQLRRRVGIVFQKPAVFPTSVYRNVIFGLPNRRQIPKREYPDIVARCLKRVGLFEEVKDRLKSPALALSVGQQQRLTIARALAVDPNYLLMDEPTSSLDPHSRDLIETLIRTEQLKRGIVLVTHNLRQAQRVADRVGVLIDGRLVETGTVSELFQSPKHPTTRAYIEKELLLESEGERVPGEAKAEKKRSLISSGE